MYKECVNCDRIGVSCKGPTFVAMPAAEILEWCKLRKGHLKLSNKKLAELSNIPEGTIARLFAGEHIDFKYESIRPILMILVGGSFDGNPCPAPIAADDHKQKEIIERLQADNAALKETVQTYEHMHHEDMQELREEHRQAVEYLKKQIKSRETAFLLMGAALAIAIIALIVILV